MFILILWLIVAVGQVVRCAMGAECSWIAYFCALSLLIFKLIIDVLERK